MSNTFADHIGNSAAIASLCAAVRAGRPAHAYLLTGPPEVGKRTLARSFATALICSQEPASDSRPPDAPCGACRSCQLASRGSHPDVALIEPEAGKRGVTIEQIRQLGHAANLHAYVARRKVFIITCVEAMPLPAANALLKTLEEPPDDTVLVLTATDAAQVLPTIASRCREVALRPVPPEEMATALAARGVAPPEANVLARLAAGRPGWAIAAARDTRRLAERSQHIRMLEDLIAQSRVARLPAAASFGEAAAAKAALNVWSGWWRDALLVQQDCAELVANVDRLDALHRAADAHRPETLWRALARIQETRQQIDANTNVRLAIEALLLDLPEAAGA